MRSLSRLFVAGALTVFALTFAPRATQADWCTSCYESGPCLVCVDHCSGACYYSCPTGDGMCSAALSGAPGQSQN